MQNGTVTTAFDAIRLTNRSFFIVFFAKVQTKNGLLAWHRTIPESMKLFWEH